MNKQISEAELENIASENVGEFLRIKRMNFGKTLQYVEGQLRIRACQIDAIERGDLASLPGRVYAIGFVRSYAEYLGLDGAKIVHLFKNQYMDGQGKDELSFPVPASETKTPPLWLVLLSIIITISVFWGWYSINSQDRTAIDYVEAVPDEIKAHITAEIISHERISKTASLIESKAIEEEVAITKEKITADENLENMSGDFEQRAGIILNIIGDSWVEIKNGAGEIIISNILNAGDRYFVPDSPGLSMSLGNAVNVEIIVDGRALKPLGKDGDVRRGIPLEISYLKTLEFKNLNGKDSE